MYPTIDGFTYIEEITFGHVGKPFLAYAQRTTHAETGAALHAETGYLRPGDAGATEWVITQPTGIVEVLTAPDPGRPLDFTDARIVLTPTAQTVTDVRRRYHLDGDTLSYEVHMAAVGEPLQLHLAATLHRAAD